MADQYLRKVSLVVADQSGSGLDLSELRIKFVVKQWDIQTPNSLSARVYNVSDQTAQLVKDEFTRVVLQAGYDGGNYGVIFDGTIVQARRGRESATDTYLDILAADGDEAYNFAILNASLAAGATPKDRADLSFKAMAEHNVGTGYIADLSGGGLPRGKVMFGMARDELRKIAATTGTTWSIQDGKVQIVPVTSYLPGEAVVLTARTGMIGLPEQTADGIKVRSLLNPRIKSAARVQIDNKSIQNAELDLRYTAINFFPRVTDDGFYRVIAVDHSGDTRGNDFYSDMICIAVDDAVTIGLATKGYS